MGCPATQVKIEAAFGTLRKSAVSDDLDIKQLEFQRELGKGVCSSKSRSELNGS